MDDDRPAAEVTFAEDVATIEASVEEIRAHSRRRCLRPSAAVARHVVAFALLIIWLICGMFVFYVVEHPYEENLRDEACVPSTVTPPADVFSVLDLANADGSEVIKQIFERYVTHYEIFNMTSDTLAVKFVPELFTDTDNQYCSNSSKPVSKWDLSGSMFFCITVVTTIGYGNLYPATDTGRIVTVVFASFGIPLMMIVVSNMGKLLTRFSDRIARRTSKCIKALRERRAARSPAANEGPPMTDEQRAVRERRRDRRQRRITALVYALIISLLGGCMFLLLPSILIGYQEDWDYVTSLYYSYITLSTIGFGDLVAGQTKTDYPELYRAFLCFWIFFGMAFVATFVSNVQSIIDNKTKQTVHTVGTRLSQSRFSINPQDYYTKISRMSKAALAGRPSIGRRSVTTKNAESAGTPQTTLDTIVEEETGDGIFLPSDKAVLDSANSPENVEGDAFAHGEMVPDYEAIVAIIDKENIERESSSRSSSFVSSSSGDTVDMLDADDY